jgi:hypothetical protein
MSKQKLTAGMYVKMSDYTTQHAANLTKGKKYEVFDVEHLAKNTYFSIINDRGEAVLCILNKCSLLYKNDWVIVPNSIFDNEVYQALLYFFAGIGFGYLLFNVIL